MFVVLWWVRSDVDDESALCRYWMMYLMCIFRASQIGQRTTKEGFTKGIDARKSFLGDYLYVAESPLSLLSRTWSVDRTAQQVLMCLWWVL